MSALKRRDNRNRILQRGESQRPDGRYTYKYVDALGKTKYVYAWNYYRQIEHRKANEMICR